jgi:peroxiredoxin
MRSDIMPGGIFPDYELPDHTGKLSKLSELQGENPLILTLARGHYCPKEHQQHMELAAFYPKVAVGYTQIATDDHHTLQEFRRQSEPSGLSFRTQTERFRRISTSRSTPTSSTIR